MYGDKGPVCDNIVAKDCYNLDNVCCKTCPHHVSPLNIGKTD